MNKLLFFVLIFLLSNNRASSLKVELKLYQPEKLLLNFSKNSFDLNNETKSRIDSFILNIYIPYSGESYTTIIYKGDSMYSSLKYDLVLAPKWCKEEYSLNKFLGVQRSVSVVDYIENRFKIQRNRIQIIDNHNQDEIGDCDFVGLYFGILKSR